MAVHVGEAPRRPRHRAEPVGQRVDVVDAELHDRAAGVALALRSPGLRLEGARERHVRLGQDHVPKRLVVEQLLHAAGGAEPAERVADHQRDPGLPARAPHPLASRDAVRDRLLDEHMAATLSARERLLLVHVVGRHQQHAIDAGMPDRLLEIRSWLAAEALGELAAPLLVPAETSQELEPCALRSVRQARRPHACPDDRNAAHPSCSRSQSAATGRVLYGTFAQPWFPSSCSRNVPFGASLAARSVCSHGIRRSSLPVIARYGCWMRSATPSRSSSAAFARPSSSSLANDFATKVSRVCGGAPSQMSLNLYGPLSPTPAFTRGSNASTRGA